MQNDGGCTSVSCTGFFLMVVSSHGKHGNHTETRKIKKIIEVEMYIVPPQPPHRIHGIQRNTRKGGGGGGMGNLFFQKRIAFIPYLISVCEEENAPSRSTSAPNGGRKTTAGVLEGFAPPAPVPLSVHSVGGLDAGSGRSQPTKSLIFEIYTSHKIQPTLNK